MLFQPSNISPDEINGTGTVDAAAGMTVSWQVSGDSAMTAYQIVIYQNNAASTQKYSTGKITLSTPFWGVSYTGETQYFSATITASALSSAGIANGNEYKLVITIYDSSNTAVVQTTPSVFRTRGTPVVSITNLPDPLTEKVYSFTASYTQAQSDPLSWVRWQLAESGNTANPFYDSGLIYGTGELQMDYDGFLTGNTYSVQCMIETCYGIQASTGWQDFSVSYDVGGNPGNVTACQIAGANCVWVSWDRIVTATSYSILRQRQGETRLVKIADTDETYGQLQDYSARSGETYTYYVFPSDPSAYLTEPMVSNPITVQYWAWSIIEAQPTGGLNEYSVIRSYLFQYGAGGVSEGGFSNNNSPTISQNFTRYPTRQGTTANYLTGSVSGYIGTVTTDKNYSDTTAQSEAIFGLSNSQNALFLSDPKGHFLRIHTSSPITLTIDHAKKPMPQTMAVSWAEVGSTDNVHVILYAGGDYYPVDQVIFTTVSIDTKTGALLWDVADDLLGQTSTLSMSGENLMQDDTGPFTSAVMAIDATTKILTAEVN